MKLPGKILVVMMLWVSAQTVIADNNACDRIANQVDKNCNSPTEICDPCYKLQWHLKNTKGEPGSVQPQDSAGKDINVEPVWKKGNLGQGIFIGIIDGDIHDHEDLRDNLSIEYSHDYYPNTTDSSVHGMSVAGIAAARANHIGVRGVAPLATFYSLNATSRFSEYQNIVNAMVRHAPITAVANNSWAASLFSTRGGRAWEMAIETGISKGFYDKGTVYVFGAGNFHCDNNARRIGSRLKGVCGGHSANYSGNANYHAVIAVGAVTDRDKVSYYSDRGANLWLCAPSDENTRYFLDDRRGLWTTSSVTPPDNRYRRGGGTSSAAPIVSGVVALMRHANPELTWRDVKLILANTARRNNPTDAGWQAGAMKYGTFTERYYFNRKCGFGVVDAHAAVSLAEQWVNLPPQVADATAKTHPSKTRDQIISSTLNIQSDIDFIEYVDIPITLASNRSYGQGWLRFGEWFRLDVKLISPSATTSRLIIANSGIDPGSSAGHLYINNGHWRFGSAKHLGEDPSGTWKLVINKNNANHFSLKEWELRIRGYKVTMDAVAARPLVEADIKEDAPNSPLSLSLAGAKWRPNLKTNEFKLIDAPPGLRITSVTTTTASHIVQLALALDGEGFADDHQFQVEASTGTASNLNRALLSDKIKILSNKPTLNKTVLAPDSVVGSPYNYTIPADTFKSAEALTYEISGEAISGLSIDPTTLEISGTPTTSGTYRVTLTTSTQDGHSAMTSFILRVRPPEHPIVIKPIRYYVMHSNNKKAFQRDGITINLNLNEIFADSEPNPTALSYAVSGLPDWLNYYSGTSMIRGSTTSTSARGDYEITIIATDEDNNSTEFSFGVRVAIGLYIRAKVFLEGKLE